MNIYCFSILVFAIVSFSVGFEVFLRRRDKIGSLYFVISFLYAWWGVFCSFCISGIFSYDTSLFLARFHNVGAAFIPVCWLHFVYVYTARNPKRVIWLYLLPGLIALFFNTDYFVPGLTHTPQFKFYAIAGPFFYLHAALFLTIIPISFWILFADAYKNSQNRQNKITFAWVSLVGYLAGIPTFLPCFGINFPQYGLVLMPLYPFCFSYFMTARGLFNLEDIAAAAHKDKLAALGILTASINHEIRAPLFMIRGVVETENNIDHAREKVLNQIDRLTGIVSRLTHFAKKGVEEEAKIEPVDLKEVLEDIRPLFQHQINYQHIQYIQEIPTDLPKLLADRRYLEEILFNLILNACQALKSTQNPRIQLSARVFERVLGLGTRVSKKTSIQSPASSPEMVLITISDNGPGFTDKQLKNIFKPFHTTKEEGTGLGLYITKQLIEKCGGRIEVQSEPNKTQFALRFNSK